MASTRRSPGAVRDPSSVAAISSRDRILIGSCIGLVTALAWAWLVHADRRMSSAAEADAMMAQMGMAMHHPWDARVAVLTFGMWTVMMVGMMTPAAAPVLMLFAQMHARSENRRVPPVVLSFALGYLVIWLGFSGLAATAQWALHEAGLLSSAMATSSAPLAGLVLIAAGAYQLTPLKNRCLTQCRSPLGFLMSNWRDGASGAVGMGIRHGAFCLGCCWALMGVLFVVGVMNLAWVGILTVFILVEKVGSAGAHVARAGGILLIAVGATMLSK